MVIAGNTRYGRLVRTGQHTYEGERINAGGKFEARKFSGSEKDVRERWQLWRQQGIDAAILYVENAMVRHAAEADAREAMARHAAEADAREEKGEQVTKNDKAQEAPSKQGPEMYVLTFHGQRTAKNVALFSDMDAALQYAQALEVALDATGMEGAYHVDTLPVWGV